MPEIEPVEDIDLAADSISKASTPEPVGPKPLWHKKGFHLPYYIQHIANDLIEGGMSESHAIATAINTVKRWSKGGKAKGGGGKGANVHPDTQAAASKAVSEWEETKAKAKSDAKMAEEIDEIESIVAFLADTDGSTEYGPAIPDYANYRPSSNANESCQTCFYFSGGRCNMFHAYVEPTYVCDEFQPGGVVQPGSKPGLTTSLAQGRSHTYSLGFVRRLGEQMGINWSNVPYMMEEFRLGLHHETAKSNNSSENPVKDAEVVRQNLEKDPEFYTKLHGIQRMQPEGNYGIVRMAENKEGPGILYLIRHGKTALNNPSDPKIERIRGWVNVPLDAKGKEQAVELGKLFANKSIDEIYSSDLSRAADVADQIGKNTGIKPDKEKKYRPWNLGNLQGEESLVVAPDIKDYVMNRPNVPVEGGESFNQFKNRFLKALKDCLDLVKEGKDVVLVTHFRCIKLAESWLDGSQKDGNINEKDFFTSTINPGQFIKVEWDGNKWDWSKGGGVSMADERMLAEMFFADGNIEDSGDGDLVWKTILREGTWKYSPGPGQEPIKKPITVIRDGKSDPTNLVISMSEIMKNFKNGAVEHVTIPTSHRDGVLENTGFVRDLRLAKDEGGKWILQAAHDFTEPDVRDKALRGTIANTSAGVLFDYRRKEDGKSFGAVLGHVALTNRPWLNGMKPFGVEASEEGGLTIMGFSEDEDFNDDDLENELDLAASKAPYGNVTYADPGYQGDKKKRYPIDNEKHVRAAWSYINKAKNGARYSSAQLSKIKGRIRSAMKRVGAKVDMSDAELIIANEAALAALLGDDWENQVELMLSEEEEPPTDKEVKNMPEDVKDDVKDTIAERLGLSEDEVKSRLARLEQLELGDKQRRIDDQCAAWQDAGKTPALVNAAKEILMADRGGTVLNLSEDGNDKALTASDVVTRLVDASPSIKLDQDQLKQMDTDENRPPDNADSENKKAELSQEVKSLAARIFFEEPELTEDEALEAAKERLLKGKDKD